MVVRHISDRADRLSLYSLKATHHKRPSRWSTTVEAALTATTIRYDQIEQTTIYCSAGRKLSENKRREEQSNTLVVTIHRHHHSTRNGVDSRSQ